MTQQYGLRAARNLADVLDSNICLDNLGINRSDLALLVGTSAAGVVQNDYQAIIGLTSNLEQQIVAASDAAVAISGALTFKASRFGDVFSGTVLASGINNDRPYYDASYSIYGPSRTSYFSPANSSGFLSGAQYKLGPIYASSIVASGLNFVGLTQPWNGYFVRYKQYLRSFGANTPLYLAPPSALASNRIWLDAEFSSFSVNASGSVSNWNDVNGRGAAIQATLANRPLLTANLRNNKPGVVFDGGDFLSLGNLGTLFPSGATAVIVASIGAPIASGDTDYNLFSTLNNTSVRWRNGAFGAFSSTVQTGFPAIAPANGTYVFTARASQAHGLSLRANGNEIASKSNSITAQVTYSAGDTYVIGANSNGSAGYFIGAIFAIALFDQVLTSKELRSVEEYFAWRFDFVYDPDRIQSIELENGQPLETEGNITTLLG